MSLELSFTLPNQEKTTQDFNEPIVKIGHILSNNLIINEKSVEPVHAIIRYENKKWILMDPAAESGVFLNDSKIENNRELSPGDNIRLGEVVIRVVTTNEIVKPTKTLIELRNRRRPSDLLFTPRAASPSGHILEVVNYWDDKVIDVEQYIPTHKSRIPITVGSQKKDN